MSARLSASVVASALLRMAQQEGGFATVVTKGDADGGAITVILAERGRRVQLLERMLHPDGRYAWGQAIAAAPNEEGIEKFLEKRRRFDPDLWILELDIASAERFAAEMAMLD